MADVLLSLTLTDDVAQHAEDLLLSRPDLVRGFTTSIAHGHGTAVALVEAAELVSGRSPRTQIRMIGSEDDMRKVLMLIKTSMPGANIFYWLVPVIEMGRL